MVADLADLVYLSRMISKHASINVIMYATQPDGYIIVIPTSILQGIKVRNHIFSEFAFRTLIKTEVTTYAIVHENSVALNKPYF